MSYCKTTQTYWYTVLERVIYAQYTNTYLVKKSFPLSPNSLSVYLFVLTGGGSSKPAMIYCWPLFSQGSDRVCCHFKLYFPRHYDCVSVSGVNIENSDRHADILILAHISENRPFILLAKVLFQSEPALRRALHLQEKTHLLHYIYITFYTYSQIVYFSIIQY